MLDIGLRPICLHNFAEQVKNSVWNLRQWRSEGSPHQTNPQLSDSNQNLVMGPRWVPDTKTDWPTDRRSIISFSYKF
jgi:hypothetical protein